jgi:hypothetical protein
MKVLVSYWILPVLSPGEERPRDIILNISERSLNVQAVKEIKAKIADRRAFDCGYNRDEEAPDYDVTILGITKLDE